MNRSTIIAWVLLLSAAACFAQDEAAKPAPKPAAKPAAKAATKAAAAAKPDADAMPPMPKDDTAVEAILATKPTTPIQMARAAHLLAGLERYDLAKQYLSKVIGAKLNDQKLVELAEAVGHEVFQTFAAKKEIQPEGRKLAEAVFRAVGKYSQDPKRLADLAKQLNDPSSEKRYAALVEIEKAQSVGAAAIAAILADAKRANEFPNLRAALVDMGNTAIGPVLAALDSKDPGLEAQAVLTIAASNLGDRKIYLIAPLCASDSSPEARDAAAKALGIAPGSAGSNRQLASLVADRAREYFSFRRPVLGTVDGQTDVWQWDSKKRQFTSKTAPEAEASRTLAVRLARDAFRLAPDDVSYRTFYFTTLLEAATFDVGLDNPLPTGAGSAADEAGKAGVDCLGAVLDEALRTDHPGAAAAAARLLGEHGSADRLLYAGGTPSALVRALSAPARRVRLAAAEAIMKLKPDRPFAGSSQLVGALTFLAQTTGSRRITAGAPTRESALRFSGDLTQDGFIVQPAASGIDLLRLVTESPDVEMVFIDTTIDHPPADMIVQRIRQDCRSSVLPVGLVAREGFLPRAEAMTRWDRAVLAFPRPHDVAGIRWEAAQLAAAAPEAIVPPEVRLVQGARALELLTDLSAKPALYDLGQIEAAALKALQFGKFDAKAAAVLANIGTANAQRALVDLASRSSAPLESRRAALTAFRTNVKKAGTLLTTKEITQQYERYNASSGESENAQLVMAGILDTIEVQAEKTSPKKPGPQTKAEKPAKVN